MTSDYVQTREELDAEPGLAYGCIMGRKDWLMIVCRLVPGLMGCKVGKVGAVQVACDTSMNPTASMWYYSRDRYEEHVSRILSQ